MAGPRACDEIRLAALALFGLLLCTADGRVLRGASASSLSTGGTATSVSQSLDDSEVITAAIATNGGDATAIQSADSGKHTQVTVADGTHSNTWTTSRHDGKPSSWSDVPACKTSPSRTNSVKDGSGRLWGYEDNTSCAYKDPKDHHPQFYWEAAPACPGSPGADSVADNQGRVWGWADGVSCAYKPSFHRKLTTFGIMSSSWGGWGSVLASFWQHLVPATPDNTQQQSTASQQPEPSNNDSTKSSPAAQKTPPATAPEVDAVVPFSDPAPRLHGTGNETLDKDIATESVAQAAADGSARAVAASAASSAVAAAGATTNNTEVISHAEANAESSASSWSWSPETGNITHQAKSEAHATADSVNGTAKASAYADASTDGLNSTAQSTAAVDGDRGKAVVQADDSLRSLKAQEFAVPVDVPVAAVPYKADNGSVSNIKGPSHSNPADPTSNAVITTQGDPQKLKPQPSAGSNSAFAAVTNALATAGQLVVGTAIPPTRPAVAVPSTPPAGSDTTQCNVVENGIGQQAIKCNKVIAGPALNRVAPTNLLGGSNAQVFSAAEAPADYEPSVISSSPSPPSSPSPSPAADPQAVHGTSTDAAAPAANTAAAVAASPAATTAVSPAANTAAAASPAVTTAVIPAANTAAVAASPAVTTAVSPAANTAAATASPEATSAVSSATTPAEVAASPSPRPIIKHTITIIHDPTITDAVTSNAANSVTSTTQDTASNTITGGPQTLSGGVNMTASSNSSTPIPAAPKSGLSLIDYYDSGASGDLSQDLPPQIPANSSQGLKNASSPIPPNSHNSSLLPAPSSSSPQPVASGPTAALADIASSVIGSAVSRPAASPVGTAAPSAIPAAAEPTAEQPATSAFSPAAIKPAAAVINGSPASARNGPAPAETHVPGSQSAWQQPVKSQAVATPPVPVSPSLSASPPTPAPVMSSAPSPAGSPPSSPAASPSLTVAAPPQVSPSLDPAASQPEAPPSAVSSKPSPVVVSPVPSPTVSPVSSDVPAPASSPSASPAMSPSPAADSIVDTSAKNLFGTTWQSAPACQSQPSKRNSVQDATSRLWWWEDNHSCAYRGPDGKPLYYAGYTEVKWDTSPPCQFTATQINAMADANGRAWGWISESSTNCKFVKGDAGQSGAALMYLDIPKQ